MTDEEIKSELCSYDPRNPLYNYDDEFAPIPPTPCYCDNCFSGRTELAKEILRLQEEIRFLRHENQDAKETLRFITRYE